MYRTLGQTGVSVSPLGFGAAPIGLLATEQHQVSTVLHQLLDLGVNLIDTAAGYAGSEVAIGIAVSARRNEFVLVSKCGQAFDDLPGEAWSPEVITATVDRALRRLRTDHLDVMLLHSCELDVLQQGDALGALIKARDAGKVRFVGYSGDNEAAAFAAALPDVAVVELSVNLCDQANIDAVLPLTQAHNVGVIAKRPIANSAWRSPEQLPGLYQEYARSYHERFTAMGVHLEDLGLDAGTDWAEVAIRFTLSQPHVHTAIIGTTNPENARRNVAAVTHGPLSTAAVQHIRDAFARASAKQSATWEALR
ncbi:MAG: aldo/keto reductase [Roseiflexaceae bacterium]|nr:aldo/keto reductase [Roseiflexaceae bacterium]